MEEGAKIIVDTNVFVAIYYSQDVLHNKITFLINSLKNYHPFYITNNYIIAETATVIYLRSKSFNLSKDFVVSAYGVKEKWFKIIQVDKVFQKDSLELYRNQKKYKGKYLSFFDCTLIAQARKQKINTILTFDKTFKRFEKEGIKILP